MIPFDCSNTPSVTIVKNKHLIILQQNNICCLDILRYYLEWKVERLFWIGLYKNSDNSKCKIDSLGKDVVNYLLTFVANKRIISDKNYHVLKL